MRACEAHTHTHGDNFPLSFSVLEFTSFLFSFSFLIGDRNIHLHYSIFICHTFFFQLGSLSRGDAWE